MKPKNKLKEFARSYISSMLINIDDITEGVPLTPEEGDYIQNQIIRLAMNIGANHYAGSKKELFKKIFEVQNKLKED